VLLLTDLAEYQLENIDKDEPLFFNDQDLLKSVVDLTASSDLDLQEKVIVDITFKSNVVFCSAVL
jgi:nucleotide exchange factor SIL1